jgi:hypothetical protein
MRVSWFFDAGYHVEVGNAEMYNLDTWTEVRRWLGSQGKPILAGSRDVLRRLYNSEINVASPNVLAATTSSLWAMKTTVSMLRGEPRPGTARCNGSRSKHACVIRKACSPPT